MVISMLHNKDLTKSSGTNLCIYCCMTPLNKDFMCVNYVTRALLISLCGGIKDIKR